MKHRSMKTRKAAKRKLDKLAPIQRVLARAVTPVQRREIVPEWKHISPEEQAQLQALANEKTAQQFRRKNRARLLKLPVAERLLGETWRHIRIHDLIMPEKLLCHFICKPRLRVRKNQATLTVEEWERFKGAVTSLMASGITVPTYQEFVDVHVQAMLPANHSWGAHNASNFLPWHREYLFSLESRLRLFNPLVTIPYWDWSIDRAVPAPLSDPADMARWGITRNATVNSLPTTAQVFNTMSATDWDTFRTRLASIHNTVHNQVGGNMMTSASPSDPVFWLHHAFVDKIWADWQKLNTGADDKPTNTSDVLQPAPLLTRTVGQTLSTVAMGFVYT